MVPIEVRNGAEFLDRRFGRSWIEDVNLDQLDITSGCHCVAAQVVGGEEGWCTNAWEHAMFQWGIVTPETPEEVEGVDFTRARQLGFLGRDSYADDPEGAPWPDLQAGWRELIASRVATRAPA